jgi:hypothetical protein
MLDVREPYPSFSHHDLLSLEVQLLVEEGGRYPPGHSCNLDGNPITYLPTPKNRVRTILTELYGIPAGKRSPSLDAPKHMCYHARLRAKTNTPLWVGGANG